MYQQPEHPHEQPQAMYPQQPVYQQPEQPQSYPTPQPYMQPPFVAQQPMPGYAPQQPMPGYAQGYPVQGVPQYPQQQMYPQPMYMPQPIVINNQISNTAVANAGLGVVIMPRRQSNAFLRLLWFIFIGYWAGFCWAFLALVFYLIPPTREVGEWMAKRIQKAFFWE
jgi:hypothetical protein